VCVAARKAGKKVVVDQWVEDSFELRELVDADRVSLTSLPALYVTPVLNFRLCLVPRNLEELESSLIMNSIHGIQTGPSGFSGYTSKHKCPFPIRKQCLVCLQYIECCSNGNSAFCIYMQSLETICPAWIIKSYVHTLAQRQNTSSGTRSKSRIRVPSKGAKRHSEEENYTKPQSHHMSLKLHVS
jgi:hypothetical protein